MLFTVDLASRVSLPDQLATQVRAALGDGSLARGERLPPARDLAAALGINMHTVLRAYQGLRDEGIVAMRQGRGAWIRDDAKPSAPKVRELATQLLAEARRAGMSLTDLQHLMNGLDAR